MKTLGELCNIVSGGTPLRSKTEFWDGGTIPWIKISNIKEKYVSEADEFITEEGLLGSSAKMLNKGTVLYTIFATLGEVGILKINACTNQAIAGLTIKDPTKLSTDYLYYYLKSKKSYVNSIGRGVAQNNINMTLLKKFVIPLPNLLKQNEIVGVLDNVSNIIDIHQKELKYLDELVKARFVEMFGNPISNPLSWEKRTLKEVCVKVNDGTHSSPESYESGQYKYITAKNIKISCFDFSNITYVSEEIHRPIYNRCNPEIGDVLYIKDGATTGIAMVNTLEEEFTLLSSVALLKQNRSIMNGYFLTALLNNEDMYKDIRNYMGGAAITRLTIAKLNSINVILPPIELQNNFADFVKQVDKSMEIIQKKIDTYQELFDKLMQEYFG